METEVRVHKVKVDYGVNDYYADFKKKNKESKVNRKIYGSVIKEFNSFQRDRLSNKGVEINMPSRLGKIELRKNKSEIRINEDGTVKNNLPVNWKDTRKLWIENEFAKEKKIKVRYTNEHTDGYSFKVFFYKRRATFKNKSIYGMRFNRKLKRDLSDSIFKGKIDAFIKE